MGGGVSVCGADAEIIRAVTGQSDYRKVRSWLAISECKRYPRLQIFPPFRHAEGNLETALSCFPAILL